MARRSTTATKPARSPQAKSRGKKRGVKKKAKAMKSHGGQGRSAAGRGTSSASKSSPARKTPRSRKPEDMSLEDWQIALRREFGQQQRFKLRNLGEHPIFSHFRVSNPESGGVYTVTIRGGKPGDNHCTCPDFAINTLGTCKHIEFTLARLWRKRGGKRALEQGQVPEHSELYLRYDAQRDIIFRPGRACPDALRKLARRYFDDRGRLKPDAYARFPDFLEKARAGGHEVVCRDDVLDFAARVRDREHLRRRLDNVVANGKAQGVFNKLLRIKLYPYQREGALFVARAGRALLADDMGLGKTIQAIAAAELLAAHGGVERVLIVCPTSLKHQWKHEIERFTRRGPEACCVVEGLAAQRDIAYRRDAFYKIVNYDVLHRDLEQVQALAPDLVILDEAQRIKNWQTRAARSVKQIDSPHAIVLTGTPLENRLEELYSIVQFVDQDRLGPLFRFLHEHQHVDETGRVVGYRNLDRIGRTLEPILLRRTRKEVVDELPDRIDKKLFLPMTTEQQRHHEENRETVARIVAKWRRYHFLSDADQRRLMIALQNMRMACDSTYLLDGNSDHGVKADELCDLLEDVLEDPEAKAVIFSQWVRMHELIASRMERRGWKYVLFNGSVPGQKRNELVQRFREDPDCRCFLSTDAGGVGLNLQHANVVINVDQPWNPAVLEQRIGRVHRLGQHRPVRVVHLVAQGTIEEGMLSLIDFKKSMFAGVLDGGEQEVFLGGTKLKRFMQTVETAAQRISEPMTETAGTGADAGAGDEAGRPAAAKSKRKRGKAAAAATAASSPASDNGVAPDAEVWQRLASAGMAFLRTLGDALNTPSDAAAADGNGCGGHSAANGGPARMVARNENTGEPELRIPLPDQRTLGQLAELLQSLSQRPGDGGDGEANRPSQ